MRMMFLPVMRCDNPRCASMFVGVGTHCPPCDARNRKISRVKRGEIASRADIREHKRLSLRKRLGLLA